MGKPEGKIENYLIKQAKAHNFLCYKFTSPSSSGVPDRILIGNGKTIFIETKSSTGKTRELQDEVIQEMREHGACVFVANTKQKIDNIITYLSTFDEIIKTTILWSLYNDQGF